MNVQEAKLIVARSVKGEATPEELGIFTNWLGGASMDEWGMIADEHEALQDQWTLVMDGPSSGWVAQLESKLDRVTQREKTKLQNRRLQNRWLESQMEEKLKVKTGKTAVIGTRWMVAASMLLLLGLGIYWYSLRERQKQQNEHQDQAVLSNTLSNPRGGAPRRLLLADGSRVWLNAASTLKYPAAFPGRERLVELSGEAYFEVADNPSVPFHVKIKDAEIAVLGTRFNMKAYKEEPVSRISLMEGEVNITRGDQKVLLQPGDQAEIEYPAVGAPPPIKILHDMDVDAVLAWKNGDMEFNDDELSVVLREIGRRYDVDIQYQGDIPDHHFTGNFSHDYSLEQVLKQLEYQHIHFEINGKTVTVMP